MGSPRSEGRSGLEMKVFKCRVSHGGPEVSGSPSFKHSRLHTAHLKPSGPASLPFSLEPEAQAGVGRGTIPLKLWTEEWN